MEITSFNYRIYTQEPGNTTDQQKRRKKQVMPSKHLTLPPFLGYPANRVENLLDVEE